jgi:hypothetical protein
MINVRCSSGTCGIVPQELEWQIDKRTSILRYRMHDQKCNKIILINKWHKKYLKKNYCPCDCQLRKCYSKCSSIKCWHKTVMERYVAYSERELDSPIMFIFIFLRTFAWKVYLSSCHLIVFTLSHSHFFSLSRFLTLASSQSL